MPWITEVRWHDHVNPNIHASAQRMLLASASELGMKQTPRLRWYKQTEEPGGSWLAGMEHFDDDRRMYGFARKNDSGRSIFVRVGLSEALTVETVAHECAHAADFADGKYTTEYRAEAFAAEFVPKIFPEIRPKAPKVAARTSRRELKSRPESVSNSTLSLNDRDALRRLVANADALRAFMTVSGTGIKLEAPGLRTARSRPTTNDRTRSLHRKWQASSGPERREAFRAYMDALKRN